MAYKYTGQEFDASTGLYDYGARQYDASLGRFLSPDTLVPDPENPQSLNRYSYVRNNPFRYSDPTGQMELDGVGCIDCLQSSLFPLIPIIGQYGVNLPTMSGQENFASYMTQSALAPEVEVPEVQVFGSEQAGLNLAQVQTGLEWAGIIPGLNTPAGLLNAGISLSQGQYGEAAFSFVTAMPVLGTVARFSRALHNSTVIAHQHHIFPQAERLSENFKSLNIDIHEFTMRLPANVHHSIHSGSPGGGHWNQAWDQFFRSNEGATAQDVFRHAGELLHRFDLDKYATPILPYGRR